MAELPETFVAGFHKESDIKKIKYNNFGNTGLKVSEVGLGTAVFSTLFGQYSEDECVKTVHNALRAGINYIDTAPYYGQGTSEEILGKSLKGIPRKAFYIATKVGRYESDPKSMFDFSAEKTRWSIDNSLEKLGLDCVDVIQIHDIDFAPSLDVVVNETLPVLEEAVKAGKARFIGITCYEMKVLAECLKSTKVKIDVVLNYSRLCLVNQELGDYLPFFQSKNLAIVNAGIFGLGLLSSGPQQWHPAVKDVMDVCREAREYCKVKGVQLARLAVFFALSQKGPCTNLLGMNTVEHLEANLSVAVDGLTSVENEVFHFLQEKVFSKIPKQSNWEGLEKIMLKLDVRSSPQIVTPTFNMSDLPGTFVPGFHDEAEVRKMKYNDFGNTGLKVSALALGAGGFCLNYGDYSVEQCKQAVHEALKRGINYIDTAPWYGHGISEDILGKALEGIPREAYYLATKVCRYEADPKLMFDFSAEKTKWSIDNSLKKLGVDYVDVIQVHDIEFAPSLDVVIDETLPVLEEAVKAGKARFIGVTGYPVSVLADCLGRSQTKIDMVLCYTRLSLVDQTLNEYLPLFQSKNLGVVNAAVHAMGLLSGQGPPKWHPATDDIKEICTEAREYCKSKGVELGRLALHYAAQQSGPGTILVGMNTPELVRANLDVILGGLSSEEKKVLDYLRDSVFTKLTKTDWEGIEIENMKKILAQ